MQVSSATAGVLGVLFALDGLLTVEGGVLIAELACVSDVLALLAN